MSELPPAPTMRPEPFTVQIDLPDLCDECAVAVHDYLLVFLELFAQHYDHRIERFYHDHSYQNMVHPEPSTIAMDDDETPF